MDEISVSSPTKVAELKEGEVSVYKVTPEQFSLSVGDKNRLSVEDSQQSGEMIKGILNGDAGPATDIVCLNAGAAIYVSGLAANVEDGVKKAQEVIASGAAKEKLDALIKLSNSFK
jgi:anthranilate phosphoribosyltransferase